MQVEILTPDKKIFTGEADGVQVPGTMGSFEVLENHAPIISSLSRGRIRVRSKGQTLYFEINSGFIENLNNKVTILTESAKEGSENTPLWRVR